MNDLRSELIQYKATTLEVCACIESEDYDNLDNLFGKRENIIDDIKVLEYNKNEFITICNELQIMKLDQDLNDAMNKKRTELKNKIYNVSINRSANKSYNKQSYMDSLFISKKI